MGATKTSRTPFIDAIYYKFCARISRNFSYTHAGMVEQPPAHAHTHIPVLRKQDDKSRRQIPSQHHTHTHHTCTHIHTNHFRHYTHAKCMLKSIRKCVCVRRCWISSSLPVRPKCAGWPGFMRPNLVLMVFCVSVCLGDEWKRKQIRMRVCVRCKDVNEIATVEKVNHMIYVDCDNNKNAKSIDWFHTVPMLHAVIGDIYLRRQLCWKFYENIVIKRLHFANACVRSLTEIKCLTKRQTSQRIQTITTCINLIKIFWNANGFYNISYLEVLLFIQDFEYELLHTIWFNLHEDWNNLKRDCLMLIMILLKPGK